MLEDNGAEFCSGLSRFKDRLAESGELTAKIFVRIDISGFTGTIFAQLDTGASWSILAPEIAEAIDAPVSAGEPATVSTRLGRFEGHLVKIPVKFVADEGRSLEFEGTFFISPDWKSGLTFLGYSGLLDSIRFALDPLANHFYFGEGWSS